MDNPRAEKVAVVTEVRERFESSSAAILTEYRGLTVKDMAALRRLLREAGSEYKVYKNTLVRFAAHDLGLDELESLLTGPTAIAFVNGDASSVAKALREYARTNPKLTVKGGVLGSKIISVADAAALADLPPRDVVLARLAGAFASPMQTFAGLLAALPRNFAYGLKALIEQRGGSADDTAADGFAVATDTSAPDDGETSTSADAPAAPPLAEASTLAETKLSVEPAPAEAESVAAVAPPTAEAAPVVHEPVAEAEPAVATAEPAEAAEPVVSKPVEVEAAEPPVLEDPVEAALTPALADEPVEVEPLAAHGIPAAVEPEILSVAPEPETEPVTDATPIDRSGDDPPSADPTTPAGDTPAAD
jgi:large subunit ribosomal protein L10